jgi:succinate-semialdehyde dehydrogenase/glutarate-semialdehyde dehydrogenase
MDKAHLITAKVQAGSIHINRIVSSDPRVPFGGVKDSGFGRELGDTGLFAFCNEKIVTSTSLGPSM